MNKKAKKEISKVFQNMPDKKLHNLYKESKKLSKECYNEMQKREKSKIEKYDKKKAILFFIEQKILEILTFGGILAIFCFIINYLHNYTIILEYGAIILYILSIVFGGLVLIYLMCCENWQWAKKRAIIK